LWRIRKAATPLPSSKISSAAVRRLGGLAERDAISLPLLASCCLIFSPITALLTRCSRRQTDGHGRAKPRRALDCHGALMQFDQSLDQRQPETGPLELARVVVMHLYERPPDLGQFLR